MAKVKKKAEVSYTLTLSQEEAEVVTSLLGRTNSVYESISDGIYNALIDADVTSEKWLVLRGGEQVSVLTLKKRDD